jgi:hypothetical protein
MQQLAPALLSSVSPRPSPNHADSLNATIPSNEMDHLVHELRQPLSAIEHLAYYLQLVSSDPVVCTHSEQIQDLIAQANRILERAVLPDSACGDL